MDTSAASNNKGPAGLKEVSMFLMGFTMLMPLRLALTCAKYAVIRFHLPMDKIGLFINILHNPMELIGLLGITLANIISIPAKKCKIITPILSVITNWLMFIFSAITLYVYTSGGDLGDPNLYMWTLVVHHFVFTLNYIFTIGVEPKDVSFSSAGAPLSAVFVTIYHKVYLYYADKYLIDDVHYWLVCGQIITNMILMYTTAFWWTAHCAMCHFNGSKCNNGDGQSKSGCGDQTQDKGSETSLIDGLKDPWTWSPAMIVVFSLGLLYCVYPGIAPFQLVDPYTGYKIELINLAIYPIPAIVVCILDHYKIGPGQKWEKCNAWWNLSWVVEAYAIFCIYIFFTVLHYPDSFFGKLIIGNSALVGFLTVSFVTAQEGLKALGISGVGMQGGENKVNGNVITFVFIISLAILNYTTLMGDAYLQVYRKAEWDHWPTEGYTRYRGFKFWFNAASKVAKNTLMNAFNADVRREMLK